MHKLSVLAFCGVLLALCAKADFIDVSASADRYSVAYLSSNSGRDLGRERPVRADSFEQFSRSMMVQTGGHDSKLANGKGFTLSKPAWNLKPSDVTESTSESADWKLSGLWNARAASISDDKGHVTDTAGVAVPANIAPVPEPGTLGLFAVALAAIALMRKRLA
ncbi:MAG TPA: PEP-CTERM sorting domain-containing protein [Candidatus Angelobacter sp.]|nr:PEP-CTERM sorting domain-containing protein [Candidatus Angelobacter sp.]